MLTSNEIRIFELLPSGHTDHDQAPIQGQTRVVPVSSDVKYETVSYVWGDGADTIVITVDGQAYSVTKTLEAALRRMRLPDSKRTLWVDQICINQNDKAEKASQVPLMNWIYSRTTNCLIWFGDIRPDIPVADAAAALELLQYLGDRNERKSDVTTPACLASEETIIAPMKALQSISLIENAWWRRIWTLQEAVLPSKAYVLWGPLKISWDTLVSASDPTQPLPYLFGPHLQAINNLISQINGLQFAKRKVEGPMRTAFRWRFRRATNPLDKVYGFMGLWPRGTLSRAECCDYRLSAASVYAMFTADLIEHHRSLQPMAILTCLPNIAPQLPSWALNMGNDGTHSDNHIRMTPVDSGRDDNPAWWLVNNYGCYNASASSEIDWEKFNLDPETNALTLQGCMVDEIVVAGAALECGDPETRHVSDESVIQRINDWYKRAEGSYKRDDQQNDSRESLFQPDSFWRGLIGNLVGDNLAPRRWATPSDVALVKQFAETGKRAILCQEIFATMALRTMFVTKTGLLGFGPREIAVGDQVWILQGGRVPFVLRPHHEENSSEKGFKSIGPSYVDGIMNGEAAREDWSSTVTLV